MISVGTSKRAYAWLRQLVAFVLLFIVWEAAGQLGMLNSLYAPAPSRIAEALAELFSDGRIWPHLEATFSAALGGLVLGILIGVAIAVIAALVPLVAELVEPVMTLLNAIDPARDSRAIIRNLAWNRHVF